MGPRTRIVGVMAVRRIVVDHVLFVVDLGASLRLFTAALAPLGCTELDVQEDGVLYRAEGLDDFSIYRGAPVTSAAHIAFDARGRGGIDASSTPRSRTAPRLVANRASGRSALRALTRRS
jgi:hypothetical protein